MIIPCYNEATRLPADAFITYLQQNKMVRLCFVNDGSRDNTHTVLESLHQQLPAQIDVLNLAQNLGKAGAVRAGMLHCASQPVDYLGYLDADLATPLDAIGDLQSALDQHPPRDFVMGSRIMFLGADIRRNAFRHYVGRVIATFISNILKLPVYDTQCGAKMLRRSVAPRLFNEPFISPWLFDVELLARLIRQHGRVNIPHHVAEVPLRQWIEQSDSRISSSYVFKMWFELYRIHQTYRDAG
jgi:glycosyltransferase involved in cell wall biosynthesis